NASSASTIRTFPDLMTRTLVRTTDKFLRLVPRFQIPYIGEPDERCERVGCVAGDWFEQESDVVAEVEAVQHAADEPACPVVANGQSVRAGVPRATRELVDAVACLAAEQQRQFALRAMH